jgi:hypothetical protein
MSTYARTLPAVALAATVLAFGCGEDPQLPPATIPNRIDTIALFALDGTPVGPPSAYAIETRTAVRTDRSPYFDFVYNVDALGQSVLLPTAVVQLGRASGIYVTGQSFESLALAPVDPSLYVDTLPVPVDSGTVAVIRSRPVTCSFGGTFAYSAKLRVLAVDTTSRGIEFEILTNINCGYRGLQLGTPTQ